ncbi:unnamed protein product [Arctia plantaginis]|uniref:Ileal sodium/bile acid cotransporter n=1 Tax=Arctia plantaginis TaxID=874455 RepID=A0A8S0Z550_ARCPL|nr:unnamed protein product [Arctia plantaginis]
MCPIWPMHLIIIYLLALCPLWVVCQTLPNLVALFEPSELTIHMDEYEFVNLTIQGTSNMEPGDKFSMITLNPELADAEFNTTYEVTPQDIINDEFKGKIRVDAKFIGRVNLQVVSTDNSGELHNITNSTLPVVVIRPQRVIDTIFTSSVAVFVSLIFINFGCAMHWPTVRDVIKRPVGPAIGMLGQFLFMPLMSFGLGFLIFPNTPALRLGMFVTSVGPGGGASNIWTFILGGNLNLSLAMTTISTIASFAMMPAWLFSLGQVVFRDAKILVPYDRIATFTAGLLIPLAIGLAMQKFTPKIAAFMVRILKGFSTTLLLFIIIFAIATNIYIFRLFSWQIVLAGMGVPWLGYSAGYLIARLFKQPHPDALAISIETGIQNTGIAIFLLRYALGQPEADITTVIPVSVAIMTPFPMMAIYIYQKIKACCINRGKHKKMDEELTPGGEAPESTIIAPIDLRGKGFEGIENKNAMTPDENITEKTGGSDVDGRTADSSDLERSAPTKAIS